MPRASSHVTLLRIPCAPFLSALLLLPPPLRGPHDVFLINSPEVRYSCGGSIGFGGLCRSSFIRYDRSDIL
ncbi:hypothetical protein BDW42DRAFT_3175 [Aspergillus taichungensis]|uniref:Secreted protein n=1 Tax=Aspergillus taichungensis TaxID=482145 RepID=A0A2J5I6C0_9EURO|nr:hypothetical protein BDW42DRAFT_3175 [Aspergillus taichungensis]